MSATTKSRRKTLIISALITLLIAMGAFLYHTWHKPLGPSLNLSSATRQTMPSTNLSSPGADPGNKTTSSPQSALKPACGGPPSIMILIAGVGSENYSTGPADAVYLVRADFLTEKISVLALVPDLWVDIPEIEDHGITQGRLSQAYLFGTKQVGFHDGKAGGSELLAQTLLENFGLRPDHYIALDHRVFRRLVDELGGIEVYFPRDLDLGLSGETGLSIKAGRRHLNGRQAEKLVRARMKEDDYHRLDNQILVLKALAAKGLTSDGLKKLPHLINILLDGINTDFSPSQIKKLVCLAEKIDPRKDIAYFHISRKLLTGKRIRDEFLDRKIHVYTWKGEATRRLIADFQDGVTTLTN